MKIIKASYNVMPEYNSILKKIESVARTCYKSEDKITDESAARMVQNLVKRQHFAMLEHASIVLRIDSDSYTWLNMLIKRLEEKIKQIKRSDEIGYKCYLHRTAMESGCIVSGNIRAWIEFIQAVIENSFPLPQFIHDFISENIDLQDIEVLFKDYLSFQTDNERCSQEWIKDLTILTTEERLIHETFSVKFTVDRGVTHELVRMRDCSFAQESTRYCNYSKGKFGNEITVIEPCFWIQDRTEDDNTMYDYWVDACEHDEAMYFQLLRKGATPQEARDVLPTSVKADIIMTTNIREWLHILNLRALGTTGQPHPQMLEVMVPLAVELTKTKLKDFMYLDNVKEMAALE